MLSVSTVFIALFITFVNCENADPLDGGAKSEFSWPESYPGNSGGGGGGGGSDGGLPINYDDITPTMLETMVRIITANIDTIESSTMMKGLMDAVDAVGGMDKVVSMDNFSDLIQKFAQGKDNTETETE